MGTICSEHTISNVRSLRKQPPGFPYILVDVFDRSWERSLRGSIQHGFNSKRPTEEFPDSCIKNGRQFEIEQMLPRKKVLEGSSDGSHQVTPVSADGCKKFVNLRDSGEQYDLASKWAFFVLWLLKQLEQVCNQPQTME
jgi:hypothetical protein